MRISGQRLKKTAERAGVEASRLAEALVQPGMGLAEAESAVRNWMDDRDHPRCKPGHVRRLAEALGASPKDIVRFTSQVRYHRGSPRKAGLVADLIRGKSVDKALNLLTFTTKRAAVNLKKALSAAIADAEQNEADVTRLVVSESRVDQAPRIKRFHQKDRGRAHPIIKPMSHITVSVEERGGKA